jgi:hypothetical protein
MTNPTLAEKLPTEPTDIVTEVLRAIHRGVPDWKIAILAEAPVFREIRERHLAERDRCVAEALQNAAEKIYSAQLDPTYSETFRSGLAHAVALLEKEFDIVPGQYRTLALMLVEARDNALEEVAKQLVDRARHIACGSQQITVTASTAAGFLIEEASKIRALKSPGREGQA